MPTSFWGGYIIVVTVVTFIALVWAVANVYYSKSDDSEVEQQVWDHDLKEGVAPAPIWWFWLIFALMVVSVIYLMLYPGLGRFAGVLEWSQGGEIDASRVAYAADFGAERERIANTPAETLALDAAMVAAGGRLFKQHCSACHGETGAGQAQLFPDLSDDNWQWGDSVAAIEQTIRLGRTAIMPPLLPTLGEDGVTAQANYAIALAAGNADAAEHAAARTQFMQLCGACHLPTGTGQPALGAPDLTHAARTYGADFEQVQQTIAAGRTGQMPAFGNKLDATQIRLLVAWLIADK